MITYITIAEKGTRPNDFRFDDVRVVKARRGQFLLTLEGQLPIARVEHDSKDEAADVETAINLCMQKLIGE